MINFTLPRNRDAYSVIRGFVYQVDLTLERWIGLQTSQILELERGEDIDVVLQSLTSAKNAGEQGRLLEQVKHLQAPITLHTPACVGALANFAEHRNSNRTLTLQFRFATTAPVGRERPSPMPRKVAGILVWEQIRKGQVTSPDDIPASQAIRSMLQKRLRPSDLPETTWHLFKQFLASASQEEWLGFIRCFEWSTGQPNSTEMGPRIRELLRQRSFASDEQHAIAQYQQLFLYVFKLLSRPGTKRLSVEDLSQQLSLPTLTDADHELLVGVIAQVSTLASRVGFAEQEIEHIRTRVEELALGKNIEMGSIVDSSPIDLTVPPPVALLHPRPGTVNSILARLSLHAWIALHGSAGLGKTQLAILLVHAHGSCIGWLRLRDLPLGQAFRHLTAASRSLTGNRHSDKTDELFGRIFAQAPRQSIFVLDDLPRLNSGDPLSEALVLLAKAASRHGSHVLTTSGHRIPPTVEDMMTSHQYQYVECPDFTDDEAISLLRLRGAPRHLLSTKFGSFVNTVAQHHPLLITAAAKYLEQHNWRFDDATFDGLMRRAFATEVSRETIHRLVRSIEDSQSRELLYRLNLFTDRFALNDVLTIAEVAPRVPHPRERLDSLKDLWVQSDSQQLLLVSPLVRALGTDDISSETRRAGHLLIAQQAIRKGELTQYDVTIIVSHLVSADEFDQAAAVVTHSLIELTREGRNVSDAGLLSVWYEMPLPAGMSLGYRICLRGAQVRARHHFAKPINAILADFENIVREASHSEAWAVILAAVNACHSLVDTDFRLANMILLRAVQLLPHGTTPDGDHLVLPPDAEIEPLIWDHVRAIALPDHLGLTPEIRAG